MSTPWTARQLRERYLDFFRAKPRGHAVLPSASLVPENDPTTLFTSAWMQPLITFLLGAPHPSGTRLVNSQRSFRAQDIEEVGDNRHTTYFEMLGNWSLGDYFKKEQLRWFFTFLTQEVGLDPAKLYVTVFRGSEALKIPRDDVAIAIWQTLFKEVGIDARAVDDAEQRGLQGGRIFSYDERKNWWSRAGVPANMPAGEPGGPDSEVFYDFGAERNLHETSPFRETPCHVNCDCGRFMEIGNSVFMQYQKQPDGSFQELPQRNVDFGGGLERILAAQANDPDVFKTDVLWPIIAELEQDTGHKYDENDDVQRAMRIIADHLRAATFLIVDGVQPSNKGQGYVLRRLLRRASVKYAALRDNPRETLKPQLGEVILRVYDDGAYFDLKEKYAVVTRTVADELQKFQRTIHAGLKILQKTTEVDAKTAFDLYQSYGFPVELTVELLEQRGQHFDRAAFQAEFAKHQALSRTASAGMFKGGLADQSEVTTKYHTATHLLHAALRKILGKHVQQKGSNITAERLRFDFTHPTALTDAEKRAVIDQVNAWIVADLPVTLQRLPKQAALAAGAVAFFAEKYPDEVTVYTVGKDVDHDWVSKELCGGPHVKHTAEIGPVQLIKEQAVAAGVRRVYLQSVL